jgi:hypothetical protein
MIQATSTLLRSTRTGGAARLPRSGIAVLGLWSAGAAGLAIIVLHLIPTCYALGLEWTGSRLLGAGIACLGLFLAPVSLPATVLHAGLALGDWWPGMLCLAGMLCTGSTGLALCHGPRAGDASP